MSIIKHTIPILEYDTNPYAVIDPTHEKLDLDLPKKCVFAFLGDYIDQFAIHHHAEKVAEFISATKKYPIYVLNDEENLLCFAKLQWVLQQPHRYSIG